MKQATLIYIAGVILAVEKTENGEKDIAAYDTRKPQWDLTEIISDLNGKGFQVLPHLNPSFMVAELQPDTNI